MGLAHAAVPQSNDVLTAQDALLRLKRPSEASPHPGRQLFDAALAGGAQASDAAIGGLAPDLRCDWVGLDTTNPDLLGHRAMWRWRPGSSAQAVAR